MSTRTDAVTAALEGKMPTVAFVQYGPDGTVPINVVQMYVCPLCGTCIPVPVEEKPEWTFPTWHVDHHLLIAQLEDDLDSLRAQVRAMLPVAESVKPSAPWTDQRGTDE